MSAPVRSLDAASASASASAKPVGFGALLRAEWTKFRTVRGWVVGLVVAAAAIVGFGLFPGVQGSCGKNGPESECVQSTGPDGERVTDSYYLVHRSLAGDGSLTARVTSLTGQLPGRDGTRAGVMPWGKAGVMLRFGDDQGMRQGGSYVALMVTGAHGVRLQYDFTHDLAGSTGSAGAVTVDSPRWLRLTRTGSAVTGEESADGTHWTTVATVHPAGLAGSTGSGATVWAGMFVTSPPYNEIVRGSLGATGAFGGPSLATATFDTVGTQGNWPDGDWTGASVGGFANDPEHGGGLARSAGGFTVTGSGDIAPAVSGVAGLGSTITETLVGTFAGLVVVVVLGVLFVTGEYRRGLIRITLAATPRRRRVLAAKAAVAGAATFAVGLVAAAVVVVAGQRVLRDHGVYVAPASLLTEVRVVVGTAALLALAAVLAVALGVLLRRGAAAVTVAVAVTVLPYLLAMSVLPANVAAWVLRISPAAAFAVQQTAARYPQVDNAYIAPNGYFPLSPWAGLAVLGAWAALALCLAAVRFERTDA